MRALHLVFAALFAISAGLQYNDPDPFGWTLLYLAAVLVAVGAWRGDRRVRLPAWGVLAVCVAWMAFLAPGMGAFIARGEPSLLAATMKAGDPVIEEAREFLGLGIVALDAVAALLWATVRRPAR